MTAGAKAIVEKMKGSSNKKEDFKNILKKSARKKKILVIQNIHQEGIKLLKDNSSYEFDL